MAQPTINGHIGGAGGGGWFGGAGVTGLGNGNQSNVRAGGGGSGYIYTASTVPNNATIGGTYLLGSEYYLSNASTIAGNGVMPTHDKTSTMTGNTGNGYAKLTLLSDWVEEYEFTYIVPENAYGTLTNTITLECDELESKTSSVNVTIINEGSEYIYIGEETTIEEIKQEIELLENHRIEVTNIDGIELTNSEYVGTGSVVKVINQSEQIIKRYKVIVKGDITGEGEVNIFDIVRLISYVFDSEEGFIWDEAIEKAGKVTESGGKPNIFDIVRLISYCFDEVDW